MNGVPSVETDELGLMGVADVGADADADVECTKDKDAADRPKAGVALSTELDDAVGVITSTAGIVTAADANGACACACAEVVLVLFAVVFCWCWGAIGVICGGI